MNKLLEGEAMRKEDFEDTLINQYTEAVNELVVESETVYRSQLNHAELSQKVNHLLKAAKVDGVDESVIWKILERKVPEFVQSAKTVKGQVKKLKLVA